MIKNGSSNIWERWDSWSEEKGFQDSSFNSLALGSVGRWLYQYVVGIDTDDQEVAFKKIIIKPHIGTGVTDVSGVYFSNYGPISSSWSVHNGQFIIEVCYFQIIINKTLPLMACNVEYLANYAL